MQAQVLIIEDEQELAELMGLYLTKEGIASDWVDTAEAALKILAEQPFDLIILDINLPGMDGFEFLQQFRRKSHLPVIIVSAREADEDIIMGLGVGADEFITKPFVPRVLSARVRAILRRTKVFSAEERKVFQFGEFELDYHGYNLKHNGSLVPMSAREFEVLRLLVEHAGTAFSLQEVYDRIWSQRYGDLSAVSVYIQRIRKKIETDYHNPQYIKTIHSKGYLFSRELVR